MSEALTWDVQVAIIAALLAHADVIALVDDRVINSEPPENYPTPFLRLSISQEDERVTLARGGRQRGDETLDAFHTDTDHYVVKQTFKAVKTALHLVKLAVGDQQVVGRVRLQTTLNDPDGASHAVIRYAWRVLPE